MAIENNSRHHFLLCAAPSDSTPRYVNKWQFSSYLHYIYSAYTVHYISYIKYTMCYKWPAICRKREWFKLRESLTLLSEQLMSLRIWSTHPAQEHPIKFSRNRRTAYDLCNTSGHKQSYSSSRMKQWSKTNIFPFKENPQNTS